MTKPFSAEEVLARVRMQLRVYVLTKSLIEANQSLEDKQRLLARKKIEQVINNLISNAVKYSEPKSSVQVVLACSGSELVVRVEDHGQGIHRDEIEKLFQPFQTTRAMTTDGEKSTGLGLAIVRRLVEGHGGKVWAESQHGEGTTFYFTLPNR